MSFHIIKKGCSAILFSAQRHASALSLKESLEEMTELSVAAGLHPIEKITQNLKTIDPACLIGLGKQKQLKIAVDSLKPKYVIFDHNLSGVQTRNLEKTLKIHVLDRNQLILEIFAQRAQSHEGKLQVELAQLMDQMPRMVGAWLGSLSRQGGKASSKGPGEKAIEIDRRQARTKIKKIKKKLEKVRKSRNQHRSARQKNRIPSFTLIGYTNSGKSSLLNTLTKSHVETKNQAFMTLDPKTRKVFIPGVNSAVITDTVGFIKKLPPHLISAFKATLEESEKADIILHVIDVSNPHKNLHIQVVNDLIEQFGWNKKPIIYVFNKTDLASEAQRIPPSYCKNRIFVSAKTKHNLDKLLIKMKEAIENINQAVVLYFSKEEEHKIYKLSQQSVIEKKEISSAGTLCYMQMPSYQINEWKNYLIKE